MLPLNGSLNQYRNIVKCAVSPRPVAKVVVLAKVTNIHTRREAHAKSAGNAKTLPNSIASVNQFFLSCHCLGIRGSFFFGCGFLFCFVSMKRLVVLLFYKNKMLFIITCVYYHILKTVLLSELILSRSLQF